MQRYVIINALKWNNLKTKTDDKFKVFTEPFSIFTYNNNISVPNFMIRYPQLLGKYCSFQKSRDVKHENIYTCNNIIIFHIQTQWCEATIEIIII